MPQLTKGGKYIFGWSLIRQDGVIHLPPDALSEYGLTDATKVILISGSKTTGGFCVTSQDLLASSKLKHILKDLPGLTVKRTVPAGTFLPYKGRHYAWVPLAADGSIYLPEQALSFLKLKSGDRLMSIRSSDISFTMGVKGPLIEKGIAHSGEMEIY